jgi:hypothetical protein
MWEGNDSQNRTGRWQPRRLDYGKYKQTNLNLTKAYLCAESAVPGAMKAFNYKNELELMTTVGGGKADNVYSQSSPTTSNRHPIPPGSSSSYIFSVQPATVSELSLDNALLFMSSVMLLLLWCRRRHFAQPDLSTIDLLSS